MQKRVCASARWDGHAHRVISGSKGIAGLRWLSSGCKPQPIEKETQVMSTKFDTDKKVQRGIESLDEALQPPIEAVYSLKRAQGEPASKAYLNTLSMAFASLIDCDICEESTDGETIICTYCLKVICSSCCKPSNGLEVCVRCYF